MRSLHPACEIHSLHIAVVCDVMRRLSVDGDTYRPIAAAAGVGRLRVSARQHGLSALSDPAVRAHDCRRDSLLHLRPVIRLLSGMSPVYTLTDILSIIITGRPWPSN